ncbi:MAG: PIN domain-containing protein [Verrucomicrobia bacterium]|nr:PIN domain-containing protein [Verrucomicrobiota bacterium]
MPPKIQAFGIDTSVFLRLLTGHPASDFSATVAALKRLHDQSSAVELFVSNQVIGETYIVLQHFYGISKGDARSAMRELFSSGNLSPLNGRPVIDLLLAKDGAGLLDRLIAQGYQHEELPTLTRDKKMARLPGAVALGL